jgi:hypothetical protein
MKFSAIALAAALAAAGAHAGTYTYNGDTTGSPTYRRALANFAGLSGIGTAVRYDTLEFTVTQSGAYDFLSLAAGNWDNFLFLYSPSFDPGSPLVNGVIGNDDFPSIGRSGFNGVNLSAGVNYVLVTTGYANSSFGAYTNSITGMGSVVVVPEPGTYGLMALGLLGVGALVRRRKAQAAA